MDVSLLLRAGLLSLQKTMPSTIDEQSALPTLELRRPCDKNRYGNPAHPGQTLILRGKAVHHARGESPAAKIGANAWPQAIVQTCIVHYADLGIMPTRVVKPLVAAA